MKNKWAGILTFFILILVYLHWFFPGLRVANDFPLISESSLKSYLDFPRVWSENGAEGLGEYSVFTLWSYPLNLISGILSNLGLGFPVLERIIFIVPILLLGSLGIWKLSNEINLTNFSKIISVILYLTNTYILLLIDGGQLSIALAYSFLPFCFLSLKQSIRGNFKNKILSGLLVSILGFFDIRFIFILFILSLIYFLYELFFIKADKKLYYLGDGLKIFFIISAIVLGIHSYWLFVLYKVPLPFGFFQYITTFNEGGFANIGHSISLLSPHWYKNVFGNVTEIRWEFLLLPILIFLAPVLKKSKDVGFWLIVVLISVFLTKGTNPPLGNIYNWLFINIPGFSLFRDSTKFFFLTAFSYSILLGITFDAIIGKIKSNKLTNWLFFSVVLYLLTLVSPVITNQMTGTFSSQPMEKDYQKLGQVIRSDGKFSRIFWIPAVPPLGYSDPIHPWVEASRLYQRKPFESGVKGTYEVFNFLREASYMGQIFDVYGIGYIGYPYLDPRRDDLHQDNIKYHYTFTRQLSNLPWLKKVNDSSIPLWKVNQHQDKFFLVSNLWWVIGSDSIYKESTKSAELSLSKNAFIFPEERLGLGNQLDKMPNAKITLNNKTARDLAASFINPNNVIFPSRQLGYSPDNTGWWKRETKDFIVFRDFLKTKYGINNDDFDLGGGWAVGEGKLKIKIPLLKNGDILLARVLESTRSGQLKFYQGDYPVGIIKTNNTGDNIRWFEVGSLKRNINNIDIESSGEINIINALAVLSKEEWQDYERYSDQLINKGRVMDFSRQNVSINIGQITYNKENSTKYSINVTNAENNFIIFSENFDTGWQLNGNGSFPAYSSLNVFNVGKDGDYNVEFEPQKYVTTGLKISVATIITVIIVLLV